ncbi:hypothetical protein ACI2IX_01420 [Leifsonia aquatica]|uniref:hypothetical protein n=1 Tax=Leifsonia aquatica TaxID=144185 RepID=UPI003850F831
MRRAHALTAIPALLLGVVLAVIPAATATADDIYGEVASYRWENQAAARVAISGDLLAVTRAVNSIEGTPAVEVMRVDEAGTVLNTQTLFTPAGAGGFGSALALDEATGRLYVGAYGQGGGVYEYLLSDAEGAWRWEAGRVFGPGDGSNGSRFGDSLSLRGDLLAIGAYSADGGPGAVFLADLVTGDVQRAGVTGLHHSGLLGDEVVLTEHLLISAAHQRKAPNGDGVQTQIGGVYVWDLDDLSAPKKVIEHPLWGLDESLHKTNLFSGPGVTGGFGFQIAANETDLFVSSPGETSYTADDRNDPLGGYNDESIDNGTTTRGAVYRFSLADLTQVGPKIVPPPHERSSGYNMAVQGNALLVAGVTRADGELGQISVYDISALATTDTPGDLMRQQPTPVQILRASDARPGDWFGGSLSAGGLRIDGGRAIVASTGRVTTVGRAYLFSPIVPNVVEWPMTIETPSIVYGQAGRITASVPGLAAALTITLDLDGQQFEDEIDPGGTAEFLFTSAQHPAGTYAAEVSFVAPGGRDSGNATGEYVVRKAPTTVVNTNVEVH